MSCLMLSELPVAEQAAIELEQAYRMTSLYRALMRSLTELPASVTGPGASLPAAAGELCSSFPPGAPNVDRQCTDHIPLVACPKGHKPHLFQRNAEGDTRWFVECSPCKIRTALHPHPEQAATAWHDGEMSDIPFTARAATAA